VCVCVCVCVCVRERERVRYVNSYTLVKLLHLWLFAIYISHVCLYIICTYSPNSAELVAQ